jgi:hypothetical protein
VKDSREVDPVLEFGGMSTLGYICLDLKCPTCDLNLFGTGEPASGEKAVFCSECRAGGSYEQIVEKRARLIPRFVSRQFVEKALRDPVASQLVRPAEL